MRCKGRFKVGTHQPLPPTKARDVPGSTVNEMPFKTLLSGRLGYANSTLLNSIRPFVVSASTGLPAEASMSIGGVLSMTSKAVKATA